MRRGQKTSPEHTVLKLLPNRDADSPGSELRAGVQGGEVNLHHFSGERFGGRLWFTAARGGENHRQGFLHGSHRDNLDRLAQIGGKLGRVAAIFAGDEHGCVQPARA